MPSPVADEAALRYERRCYRRVGGAALEAHLFRPADAAPAPRPAVLWFFSGGWSEGEAARVFPEARACAAWGLVAVAAEYRLIQAHGTTPHEAVADARAALGWMVDRAGELGIDARRIAAAGASAGAHLAATTAFGPGPDGGAPKRPRALALTSPVLDTTPATWAREGAKPAIRRLIGLFGEAGARVSPFHRVHGSWPATLLIHGDADRTVPAGHSERFAARLESLGVPAELAVVPGAGHGFFRYGAHGNAGFDDRMARTRRFLARVVTAASDEEHA